MNIVLNITRIQASIEKVFELTTTAKYWPQWHPSCIQVEGAIEAPYQVGDEIHQVANVAGKIRSGTWSVTELIPLERVTLDIDGGRLEIRYTFVQLGRETRVVRRLTYPTPTDMDEYSAADLEKVMHEESELGLQQLKELIEKN